MLTGPFSSVERRGRVRWSAQDRALLLQARTNYKSMTAYQLAAVVRMYADTTDDNRLRSGNLNGTIDNRLKKTAEHLRLAAAAMVHKTRKLEHGSETIDKMQEEADMAKIEAADLRTALKVSQTQLSQLQ